MGRNRNRSFSNAFGGLEDGSASHGSAATPEGSNAFGNNVGVTVDDLYVVDRHLKRFRGNLCPARFVPLALRRRTTQHRDFAVEGDSNRAVLPRTEAADLDVRRDTDTEWLPASFTTLSLLGAQSFVVDVLKELIERNLVLAAVVGQPGRSLEGKLFGRDEVFTPELRGVEPELVGELVDGALQEIGGFGPSRTAIGLAPHFIGERSYCAGADVRNVVDPCHHHPGKRGDDRRHPREICAAVHGEGEIRGKDAPVGTRA